MDIEDTFICKQCEACFEIGTRYEYEDFLFCSPECCSSWQVEYGEWLDDLNREMQCKGMNDECF